MLSGFIQLGHGAKENVAVAGQVAVFLHLHIAPAAVFGYRAQAGRHIRVTGTQPATGAQFRLQWGHLVDFVVRIKAQEYALSLSKVRVLAVYQQNFAAAAVSGGGQRLFKAFAVQGTVVGGKVAKGKAGERQGHDGQPGQQAGHAGEEKLSSSQHTPKAAKICSSG